MRTLILVVLTLPTVANSEGILLELQGSPAGISTVDYDCGAYGQLLVRYADAGESHLALVPIAGSETAMAQQISGSGVRYTAGFWEWWIKGDEATLRSLVADEGAPPEAECRAAG